MYVCINNYLSPHLQIKYSSTSIFFNSRNTSEIHILSSIAPVWIYLLAVSLVLGGGKSHRKSTGGEYVGWGMITVLFLAWKTHAIASMYELVLYQCPKSIIGFPTNLCVSDKVFRAIAIATLFQSKKKKQWVKYKHLTEFDVLSPVLILWTLLLGWLDFGFIVMAMNPWFALWRKSKSLLNVLNIS